MGTFNMRPVLDGRYENEYGHPYNGFNWSGIPISCKTIICLSLCGYKLRTRPRNLKLKTESRARKEIEKGKLSTINEQSPIQVLRKNIAHKNNH